MLLGKKEKKIIINLSFLQTNKQKKALLNFTKILKQLYMGKLYIGYVKNTYNMNSVLFGMPLTFVIPCAVSVPLFRFLPISEKKNAGDQQTLYVVYLF